MTINQIYFSQHGLALDKAENTDRPLSVDGIKQTKDVANQLKSANVPVSCVFHSGKLRAQQTAEIFSSSLNISSVTKLSGMSPMDDCRILIDNLSTDHALYVGHLPHLDKVVSSLLTRSESAQVIAFKNSGVVCLKNEQNIFSIGWYLTPQFVYC